MLGLGSTVTCRHGIFREVILFQSKIFCLDHSVFIRNFCGNMFTIFFVEADSCSADRSLLIFINNCYIDCSGFCFFSWARSTSTTSGSVTTAAASIGVDLAECEGNFWLPLCKGDCGFILGNVVSIRHGWLGNVIGSERNVLNFELSAAVCFVGSKDRKIFFKQW